MKKNKQRRFPRNQGFTLIEILVALVILAIIGSITAIGLQTAIRAQKIINQKAERLASIQSTIIVLERDLLQIINRPVLDADGSLLPAVMVRYSGGKVSLEFTRAGYINPFATLNRTTLQRIKYSWDGKSLLRTTWQVLDRVPNSTQQPQILLTGVSSFTIQFMDANHHMAIPGETPILPPGSQQQQSPPLIPPPLAIEVDLVTDSFGAIKRIIPLAR